MLSVARKPADPLQNPNTRFAQIQATRTSLIEARQVLGRNMMAVKARQTVLLTSQAIEQSKLQNSTLYSERWQRQIVSLEYSVENLEEDEDQVYHSTLAVRKRRLSHLRQEKHKADTDSRDATNRLGDIRRQLVMIEALIERARRKKNQLEADYNANEDESGRFIAVSRLTRSEASRVVGYMCAGHPVKTITDRVYMLGVALCFDLLGSRAARQTLIVLLGALGASTEPVFQQLQARYPHIPFTDEQYRLIFPFHN